MLYRRLFGADSLREASRSRLKDLEARYAYGLGPLWPMPSLMMPYWDGICVIRHTNLMPLRCSDEQLTEP